MTNEVNEKKYKKEKNKETMLTSVVNVEVKTWKL